MRKLEGIEDRVSVVEGDVLEPQELLAAMERHRVEQVVHLAFGVGGPTRERVVPYARVQTMGTANVFETARIHGIRRVVNASSMAVYGPHEATSLREDEPKRPDSLYGACKLWSEHLADVYNGEYGMEIISLRPCSVFGLGRAWRGSFASGLVHVRDLPHYMALAELAVRGEPITMPPGAQLADWCYAADAAEGRWLALTAEDPPHREFNMRASSARSATTPRSCAGCSRRHASRSASTRPPSASSWTTRGSARSWASSRNTRSRAGSRTTSSASARRPTSPAASGSSHVGCRQGEGPRPLLCVRARSSEERTPSWPIVTRG